METHAPGSRPSGAAVRCAGLCAGLALAALARLALAGLPPDERATLWVLDRGADRALALDRDLEVKTSVSIDAPRRVVACADGGAWIAGASDGRDSLVRIGTDGSRIRSFEFARMLDLEPAGAEVVVLEQGQACTVWLLDESGRARSLRAMPGASCVAARGELILTGHRGGEAVLQEHGDPGAVRAWARIGTRLADVQPGPRRGSWWILDAGGGGRILLVDDLLATLWSVNLEREPGSTDPALEPVRGEERVWIAEPGSSRVRRFGPGGVLELELGLPAREAGLVLAEAVPGVVVASPGALLELAPGGSGDLAARRAQGGFAWIADVAGVPLRDGPSGAGGAPRRAGSSRRGWRPRGAPRAACGRARAPRRGPPSGALRTALRARAPRTR